MQEELEIQCPFCFEMITVLIDPSVESQSYIEDCSVCCRPIQISAICENDEVINVSVDRS